MTASSSPLLELPNEIFLHILKLGADPLPYKGPYRGPPLKARYAKLCLVCKAFYYTLTPLIWKDVSIRGFRALESLHKSLHPDSKAAKLIHSFEFANVPRKSSPPRVYSQLKRQEPGLTDVPITDYDHLNFILSKLTNVRVLRLSYGFRGSFGNPDLALLPCPDESLEEIRLGSASISPAELARILQFKKLEKLRLVEDFAAEVWEDSLPAVRTQAKNLGLDCTNSSTKHTPSGPVSGLGGVPCYVLRSIVSCFDTLTSLEVRIRSDAFEMGKLDTCLIELAQRCNLSTLMLSTTAPLRGRRLEIDFSLWRLQKLWIDSISLWPIRDSWDQREGFYKILPPSLKVLHMTFPWQVGTEYGPEPYDGAFQLNSISPQDFVSLGEQDISANRFAWICNLLNECLDASGKHTSCLPNLETVDLHDRGCYTTEKSLLRTPIWSTFKLPGSIATKFADRGIKVDISAVNWKSRTPNDIRWQEGAWTVEL